MLPGALEARAQRAYDAQQRRSIWYRRSDRAAVGACIGSALCALFTFAPAPELRIGVLLFGVSGAVAIATRIGAWATSYGNRGLGQESKADIADRGHARSVLMGSRLRPLEREHGHSLVSLLALLGTAPVVIVLAPQRTESMAQAIAGVWSACLVTGLSHALRKALRERTQRAPSQRVNSFSDSAKIFRITSPQRSRKAGPGSYRSQV